LDKCEDSHKQTKRT